MFKDNKFTVMAGGKEIICDVLFTFHSQQTDKDYMAFTDHTKNRAGDVNVFYAIYDPNAEQISLAPIETEQEWRMVRDLMNGLSDDVEERITKNIKANDEPKTEE